MPPIADARPNVCPSARPPTPRALQQERLWKQAAAMAVAYEIVRLRGKFKLRPPPEGQRR